MSDRTVEDKLTSLNYQKEVKGKKWVNGNRIVHVEQSKERNRFRIDWREEWKNHHAIIFDYSTVGGPVCVVPVTEFLGSHFVDKKRKQDSYKNSGYWWSQKFPIDHELTQLVLKFENRWDVL